MHHGLRLTVLESTIRLSSILQLRRAVLLSSILRELGITILLDPGLLRSILDLWIAWMVWLRRVVNSNLLVSYHSWLLLVTRLLNGTFVL